MVWRPVGMSAVARPDSGAGLSAAGWPSTVACQPGKKSTGRVIVPAWVRVTENCSCRPDGAQATTSATGSAGGALPVTREKARAEVV
jgi:hypothetical protein